MSQRNPMNERYTNEDRKGAARKSAASAKPKTKAGSSVTVVSNKKTPQQKKADAKAERRQAEKRRTELNRKYYKPDTEAYKRYRRMWWVCLIIAVACVTASWVLRGVIPEQATVVVLVLAYVFIIAAFVIDFWKIRKERTKYQERMVAKEDSDAKAAKAAARREKTKAAQAAAAGTQADNQATNADGANEGVDAGAKAPSFKDKLLGIFGGKKES